MIGLLHTCDLKRSATVGTNGRSQMQTLYTSLSCLVLPMNNRTAIENKFEIGRAYQFFFDDGTDVKPGDKLVYNSATYMVRSVKPYATPPVAHIEASCEQEIS